MAGRGRGQRGRPPNDVLGKRAQDAQAASQSQIRFPYGGGNQPKPSQKSLKIQRLVQEKAECSNFKRKEWVEKKAS